MVEGKTSDPQLRWIYEGTKSLVNREDYLLGKKVDKNFELYSDAVIKEKESGIEAVEKLPPRISDNGSSSKISNLEVDIVRTEDPLVAIKMKEERIRQEKLENPLVKLKMQKMLKKAMERKERRRLKKQKKLEKRKRRRRHCSSGSSDGGRHSEKSKCDNANEMDVMVPSSSSEPSSNAERERHVRKHLQKDSHIPEHMRPKHSSSSESDDNDNEKREAARKSRTEKYGLVKRSKQNLESDKTVNPYKSLPRKRSMEPYKRPERRKLTDEEVETKRKEMMENANWRDQVRVHNIRKSIQRDEEEGRRNEGKAVNFIRPMLNSAASTMTVEQQLNSHRGGLQRISGFTDQKFAKR